MPDQPKGPSMTRTNRNEQTMRTFTPGPSRARMAQPDAHAKREPQDITIERVRLAPGVYALRLAWVSVASTGGVNTRRKAVANSALVGEASLVPVLETLYAAYLREQARLPGTGIPFLAPRRPSGDQRPTEAGNGPSGQTASSAPLGLTVVHPLPSQPVHDAGTVKLAPGTKPFPPTWGKVVPPKALTHPDILPEEPC